MDFAHEGFQYPSTRYSGSKRRFLGWIWENVRELEFECVLDVFGGTCSVSLMFKRYGKRVLYNDLLKFNQIIGNAIIENGSETVSDEDILKVLGNDLEIYPNFIEQEYDGIFFTREENAWLDRVITNIGRVENMYKRSILMAGLFQASLAKRPFNLFHRANLNVRQSKVTRNFGNKTTWETPFQVLFKRFVAEYNQAVFSNNRENLVIGGYDAINSPNGVDLVYIDPPYFSNNSNYGTNYLARYHFLEGLSDYNEWIKKHRSLYSQTKRIPDDEAIRRFTRKSNIYPSFTKLIERFQESIIVLSYQENGIPSRDEIIKMLNQIGKEVEVSEKPHSYALSKRKNKELLFIAL